MKNAGVTCSKDKKQVETMNPARRWSPARRPASETSTDFWGEDGAVFIRLDECEPRGLKNSTPRDRPTTHGCYRVLHRIGLQSFFSRPVREPRLTREAVPFFSRDHYRAAIPAFQSCEQRRMRTLCSNSCVRPSSIVLDARTTSHVLTSFGSQALCRSNCRYQGRSMLSR
jgi:hypothetical protein